MSAGEPRIFVQLHTRVNVGDFEAEDVSVGVSGLSFEATDAEIDRALNTANVVYDRLRQDMRQKVAVIRREAKTRSEMTDAQLTEEWESRP